MGGITSVPALVLCTGHLWQTRLCAQWCVLCMRTVLQVMAELDLANSKLPELITEALVLKRKQKAQMAQQ